MDSTCLYFSIEFSTSTLIWLRVHVEYNLVTLSNTGSLGPSWGGLWASPRPTISDGQIVGIWNTTPIRAQAIEAVFHIWIKAFKVALCRENGSWPMTRTGGTAPFLVFTRSRISARVAKYAIAISRISNLKVAHWRWWGTVWRAADTSNSKTHTCVGGIFSRIWRTWEK